jgi:concanavalin A-like lectin/glucanase superfamily protein
MSARVGRTRFGKLPVGPVVGVLAAVCLTAMVASPASALGATLNRESAASTYDNAVMADRPVGFWHDAPGHDLVGQRHARPVGAPGATRTPNGDSAATFDGTRRYLEIADSNRWSPATTRRLTVEAWMRPSTLQFPNCYVHWLGKGEPGQQEWTLRMYARSTPCESPQRSNRVSVYAFNRSGGLGTGAYFQGGLDRVPVMQPNAWVHVVGVINAVDKSATYPNGYVRMYRNGRLVNTRDLSSTVPITLQNGTAPLRIGTQDLGGFFRGAIGKVALYDRELSASRVLAHYRAMNSPG